MDDLRVELQQVFHEVFDDEEIRLHDEMTAADIDGWDSLAHIDLIVAVERRFGVKFATAEISNLKAYGQNVGSMLAMLSRKLAAK
jgi:acyl carrier protein